MTVLLKILSAVGLALTVGPAVFVFARTVSWETHSTLMFVGTVLWFVTAPFWMEDPDPAASAPDGAE